MSLRRYCWTAFAYPHTYVYINIICIYTHINEYLKEEFLGQTIHDF